MFCLYFRTPFPEVTERSSTKLCHMLESEPNLKGDGHNLGNSPPPKTWTPKLPIFRWFYLWKEMSYGQTEKMYKLQRVPLHFFNIW